MKKVLIVARYFGTRVPGLMKYLPGFGWQPVLLAPFPLPDANLSSKYQIISTPYRDALYFWKRLFRMDQNVDFRSEVKQRAGITSKNTVIDSLLTLGGAIVNYPDSDKGWRRFAVAAGFELLHKDKFDAIISSSSPVTAHVIACELKKRAKVPWLADLRDPWSQNHNYSYGPVRRWFDKWLELKTLGVADSLVTVSQPWANNLKTLHRGKTSYAVTNGFDPDQINNPPVALTEKMSISYTGLVYKGKQDPARLFEAVKTLIDEKTIDPEKIELRFYGLTGGWLDEEIKSFHLQDIVKIYGNVSRDMAIQAQRESHILLLLNWDNPKEKGTIPSKVFEYMATLRPVLAIGGAEDDAIQQILTETKAGYHSNSVIEIKYWLRQRYSEFIASGEVAAIGNPDAIASYSQREMARKFADILEQLTNR